MDRAPVLPMNDHDSAPIPAAWNLPTAFTTRLQPRGMFVSVSLTIPSHITAHSIRHLFGEGEGSRRWGRVPKLMRLGRLGRQQQLYFLGLENRKSNSVVQCLRHHSYICSHPTGASKCESHRASPVFQISKNGLPAPSSAMKKCSNSLHQPTPERRLASWRRLS